MMISLETSALILGVIAIIPGIVVLLKYFRSLNKSSCETGQDNKEFLKLASSLVTYPSWEQEREMRAFKYQLEVDAAIQEYLSTKPQVVSEDDSRSYFLLNPIPLPGSGATITAQHYTYPETLKSVQTHCQFCGNNFVPDKFGRCSSCGGPQQ